VKAKAPTSSVSNRPQQKSRRNPVGTFVESVQCAKRSSQDCIVGGNRKQAALPMQDYLEAGSQRSATSVTFSRELHDATLSVNTHCVGYAVDARRATD